MTSKMRALVIYCPCWFCRTVCRGEGLVSSFTQRFLFILSTTGVSISIAAWAEIFLITSKSRPVFISIQLPVRRRFPWDRATGMCMLPDICVLCQGYVFLELHLRFSACVNCLVLQHGDNYALFLALLTSPETSL